MIIMIIDTVTYFSINSVSVYNNVHEQCSIGSTQEVSLSNRKMRQRAIYPFSHKPPLASLSMLVRASPTSPPQKRGVNIEGDVTESSVQETDITSTHQVDDTPERRSPG